MMQSRPSIAIPWIVAISLAAAVAVGIVGWLLHRPPPPDDRGRIRVIAGATPVAPAGEVPLAPLPALATSAAPSPEQTKALEAAAIDTFPMIYAVQIDCEPDCTLVATLGPNATTGDWPRARWPYDGNLERFLAGWGYTPRGSLVVDQPGDNDTLLRLPITVAPRR